MSFSLSPNDSQENVVDAVNYLLSNFKGSVSANNTNGQVTGPANQILSYLYKYLAVKYADSFDGQTNFSNSPTNRLYYGLRNTDSSVESTNYQDYVWYQVTGGFGTTKFFYYSVTGGRSIVIQIATTSPSTNYVQETGSSIDLDISTVIPSSFYPPVGIPYSTGSSWSSSYSLSGTGSVIPLTTGATLNNPTISNYEDRTASSAPSYVAGRLWYDNTQSTLAYYNDITNNLVHLGQEVQVKVLNNTGSTISIGSPVYITGTSSGQIYPNVALAKADVQATSAVIGLTTQAIASGAAGYITTVGILQPCNTGTFTVGQVLYLSPYSAGQLMNTIPPTGYAVRVGIVAYANTPNGSIYVRQSNSYVAAAQIVGQVALTNGGTNASLTAAAGGVVYSGASALAINAVGTSGQVLTSAGAGAPIWATPTTGTITAVTATAPVTSSGGSAPNISMSAATTSISGYLTSTDWNTFNGKQPAGMYVNSVSGTTGRITSTGGVTPVIDLASGIATAGTTGSSTLIPVVTIDTYGRVTTITTAANPQGTVTSVTGTAPVVSSGGSTPAISIPAATTSVSGYITSTDWNTFNGKQPAGTYVNSVSGTTGRISSTGGVTPVIDLVSGIVTAGTTGSSALIPVITVDTYGRVTTITTASNPQGTVTSVTGTAPVVSSGGATPAISMAAATASVNGYLTSSDWTTFNNKSNTSGTVTSVSVVSANGFAGTVATATSTPAITLTTSITGVLKGNGTAISAAVANTDYIPLSTVLTKTADYTITGTDTWIINNKTGSALVLTFPAASSWTGRSITVKNMQAQLVNSVASDIVPIGSTTASTAILLGVIGNWATVVSDGTNWVVMQAASNNNLLLE